MLSMYYVKRLQETTFDMVQQIPLIDRLVRL